MTNELLIRIGFVAYRKIELLLAQLLCGVGEYGSVDILRSFMLAGFKKLSLRKERNL